MYRKQFIESVEQGLIAVEAGEVYGTDEVRSRLAEKKGSSLFQLGKLKFSLPLMR